MAEYIDKTVALSIREPPKSNRYYQTDNLDDAYEQGWDEALSYIEKIPAADVAPVVHGRWITTSGEVFPGSSQFLCYSHKHEECGFQYVGLNENEYDYCPKCGAKMDRGRLMKQDMSKTCGFGYQAMWVKRDSGEISEKEFIQWYDEHCANCLYMNEICMLGEVE